MSGPRQFVTLKSGMKLPAAKLLKTMPAPKLSAVSIRPMKTSSGGKGFHVTHVMTASKPQAFVFSDPKTMSAHLTRIAHAEWRKPDQNEAARMATTLDIG
ncbi:MAG: hypothetical protein ABSD56_01565 [Bryobacteraceae bacterium]|jgi:hypothetical protein